MPIVRRRGRSSIMAASATGVGAPAWSRNSRATISRSSPPSIRAPASRSVSRRPGDASAGPSSGTNVPERMRSRSPMAQAYRARRRTPEAPRPGTRAEPGSGRAGEVRADQGVVAAILPLVHSTLVDTEQQGAVLYRCSLSRLGRSSGRASDRSQARSSGSTRRANEFRRKPAHEGLAPAHPSRHRSRGGARSRCRAVVRRRRGVCAAKRRRCRRRADPDRSPRRSTARRRARGSPKDEPVPSCAAVKGIVWYAVTAPRRGAMVARLAADPDHGAVVVVQRIVRSKRYEAACALTGKQGRANVAWYAYAGRSYLIGVARPTAASGGDFQLEGDRRGAGTPATRDASDGGGESSRPSIRSWTARTRGRWA